MDITSARLRAQRLSAGHLASELARAHVNGRVYWFSPARAARAASPAAHLLPLYDEYLIAYRDRSAALDAARWKRLVAHDPFIAPVIVDGWVVGGWRRRLEKNGMTISIAPFSRFGALTRRAIAESARRYARFFGLDVRSR